MKSKIAIIFPGQGSQYVGMGRNIYEAYLEARMVFDEARGSLGFDIAGLCFNGPEETLNLTVNTQPAILTVSIALWRVLEGKGIIPDFVAGHSLGEYAAVVAAGGIPFKEAVSIVKKRGQFMQEAVPEGRGMMAAILGLEREVIMEICRESLKEGTVSPANYNCPGQVVIVGEKGAVEQAMEMAKARGAKRTVSLQVSVPSHSPLMSGAGERLGKEMEMLSISNLNIPLISNTDARPVRSSEEVRSALLRQIVSPVLWEDSVKFMASSGTDTFIETGPGRVLSGLVKRTVPVAKILNVEDRESLEKTIKDLRLGE